MPNASEISAQVASESDRRARLGAPAFGGGLLYLLSGIVISSTLNGAPTVGVVQGLKPALAGIARPAVSPRTAEVKFISHHAFPLIAGSALAAVSIGALTLVLLLLWDAVRFRRPQSWSAARPLVLAGGVAFALVSLAHQIIGAINTHNFAVGQDHSRHAVENALTQGAGNVASQYLALLGGLALAAGMIAVMLNAIRVGLVARWMGFLGIFSAVLIFLPIGGATLGVVPAFWLVGAGILLQRRWPGGDPPAWDAGEARPWPSQAELRAARQSANSSQGSADVAPAPAALPSGASAGKRRRKRGGRR
ncbi:MAG: hypothetical protein E6G34_09210 [Actinobacteria bacterium]|nr:MAG: hypothetical protein E6G34_09210 [Actinomycetota bacterium]